MRTQAAGKRNQIIEIQRATEIESDGGEVVRVWETRARIRASRRMPTAKEKELAGQINAEGSYIFAYHKNDFPFIRPDDRIINGSLVCEIAGILPGDVRQQFIELICRAKIQEGA